jgi:molybdopterin-binding protein
VVAAREALEDLAPRRGRGERQQASDLLRRKLSEMRPHQRLALGGRAPAELRPDLGGRDRRIVARRGLAIPAPGAGSAHGGALPLDRHADGCRAASGPRSRFRPSERPREADVKISARNQVPAQVVGITAGAATANVELDANGLRLVASITVEAVRELGLAEGSEVTAVIKASDVMLAIAD